MAKVKQKVCIRATMFTDLALVTELEFEVPDEELDNPEYVESYRWEAARNEDGGAFAEEGPGDWRQDEVEVLGELEVIKDE